MKTGSRPTPPPKSSQQTIFIGVAMLVAMCLFLAQSNSSNSWRRFTDVHGTLYMELMLLCAAPAFAACALIASRRGASARVPPAAAGCMERQETDVRRALRTGEFIPYYQPIVSLATGRIVGFEVLARWNHPTRGLLLPDAFIHLMEAQHLCGSLSLTLLRQVTKDAVAWPAHWTFAFNASVGQLRDLPDFVRDSARVAGGKLDPRRIELELTETMLIEDMELARGIVTGLHRHGVRVVLDDFGTGYANLQHLRELPFDRIKIDRGFVKDLDSPRTEACLRAMLSLAGSLGATVVAEGVEDAAAEQKLRDMGCDFAQGFYYSPPIPAEAVPRLTPRATALAAE